MIIKAPWTQKIVDHLNAWQSSGLFHPYTCDSGHDLVATPDGWICSKVGCSYTQDWAYELVSMDQFEEHQNTLLTALQAGRRYPV